MEIAGLKLAEHEVGQERVHLYMSTLPHFKDPRKWCQHAATITYRNIIEGEV